MGDKKILMVAIAGFAAVVLAAGLYMQRSPLDMISPLPVTPGQEVPEETPPKGTSEQELADLIRVTTPKAHTVVGSPLRVAGEARGNWYFEASFPIKILDANGKQLGSAVTQAKGEWMTTDFVPFDVSLTFSKPTTATGTLVLEKDNPSGLPEHDRELRIPVRFSAATTGECKPQGCSGQVCSDKDIVTTCEFRPEYACYKTAACARQTDGECGWTETQTLKACIEKAQKEGGDEKIL